MKFMVKFLIALFLIGGLLCGPAVIWASPFLICDPQAGVTHYALTGPGWVPVSVPAQGDGSIKMDVAGSAVGANSLTVAACKDDLTWGELCSAFVPFVFTRPSAPASPANIGLSK